MGDKADKSRKTVGFGCCPNPTNPTNTFRYVGLSGDDPGPRVSVARVPPPTDYATPKTIRPYSLGQNPEWDAVSRMLAAGLVTVCPDPMAVGLVRVEMVRRDER